MSYPYPEQKYWGEDGEVSAVFRLYHHTAEPG